MEMRRHHNGFVIGLPKINKGNDVIWVIVDQLMKYTLFLLMRTNSMIKLANLYVNKMVRLNGVPTSIVLD